MIPSAPSPPMRSPPPMSRPPPPPMRPPPPMSRPPPDLVRAHKKRKKQGHVTIVLDRSGSMHQFGEEGYTSVQATISELPDIRGPSCLVSVFAFDHECTQLANGALAKDYTLDREAVKPRGMTALRDALNDAIEFIGTLPDDQEKFLVVFTDGDDNTSKVSSAQISKMLGALKNVDISWLAAAEADMQTAEDLGIRTNDVLKVGTCGNNMTAAMRSSSLKSNEGFTRAQRQRSVQTPHI